MYHSTLSDHIPITWNPGAHNWPKTVLESIFLVTTYCPLDKLRLPDLVLFLLSLGHRLGCCLVYFKGRSLAVFSLALASMCYFELPEYPKYLLDL